MARRPTLTFVITATLMTGLAQTPAAQTPVQIHPPAGTGGPVVIAVLADHFTSAEEEQFKEAAANFFQYGLLADPDYAGRAQEFTIVTIFEPWANAAGGPSSNYGFEIGVGSSNCSISWNPGTSAALATAAAATAFEHVVVIGNYGYVFGCTSGFWSYVTAGAVGQTVLQHEFGHLLAALFDEYASASQTTARYPDALDCRNCSTKSPPHWYSLQLPGVTNEPGCALFGLGIVHPFPSCRMGTLDASFCLLCSRELDHAYAYYRNPASAASRTGCTTPGRPAMPTNLRISAAGLFGQPTPAPSPPAPPTVRLVVSFDRTSRTALVQEAIESSGNVVPAHRRFGMYVYEVSEPGRVLSVGVVRDDAFQARDYRGSQPRHQAGPTEAATVLVPIPGETIATLLTPGRAVRLAFYQLDPSVTLPLITPAVLEGLKAKKLAEPVTAVAPDDLRKAIM